MTKEKKNCGWPSYLVSVPQTNGAAQRKFSHKKIVHPAESELQILHLILLHVAMDSLCSENKKNNNKPTY